MCVCVCVCVCVSIYISKHPFLGVKWVQILFYHPNILLKQEQTKTNWNHGPPYIPLPKIMCI